jgi:hypothetical protein
MYPWDSSNQGEYRPSLSPFVAGPVPRENSPAPAQAVQVALDRRDNGGDTVPSGQHATRPTASLTRQ